VASFPSLINVQGQATYIMVLKDAGGLVKLYALVNVEQYGIVATGDTQAKAMHAYKELLSENGIIDQEPEEDIVVGEKMVTGRITSIKSVIVDGNTVFYITLGKAGTFRASVELVNGSYRNESLIFMEKGDTVSITYIDSEDEIKQALNIDFAE